ncbi:MAG: peroxidase family protein [Leptolyngbyaceae bacterium]|nr:peroxidase family protein [Leptolyngbyaceae bacterium]
MLSNDLPFFASAWFGILDNSDRENPTRGDRLFDDFYLNGVIPGTRVQIDLTSTNIDPFLQLINADTGNVIASNDDGGFGLNSQLQFTIQPNVNYILRSTTFEANATGTYTIESNIGQLTPASLLSDNQSFDGTLSLTDFPNPHRDDRFYDGYLLTNLQPGEVVVIDAFGDSDPFLQLVDANTGNVLLEDNNRDSSLNSILSFTVEAGVEYIVQVTSRFENDTFDYGLTTQSFLPADSEDLLTQRDPFLSRRFDPSLLSSPIDGRGNNLLNREWGAARTNFIDTVPLEYGNGFSTPAGGDRPNARVISNTISQQEGIVPDPRGLTNLIWAWGQFLDHDITLNPDIQEGRLVNIPIPTNDPALNPGNVISLRESEFDPATGTNARNPRRLTNAITAFVDGSNVYGSSEEELNALRAFVGGQLRISEGNLLPIELENGRPQFLAGDGRANENAVLTSMHTLFVREHNRLAAELAETHPRWNDEQIFQRARQINIAQIQNITFNEYLPTLLGEELPDYEGYDSQVNPSIERVFANAAFRLGHTQLTSIIPQLAPDGRPSGADLRLSDIFFPGVDLVQEQDIGGFIRGVASTQSQRVDNLVIEDVRSLLFGEGPNSPARDLAAINIERGRLNGLADYNTVRETYGLSRVTSFSQISSDPQIQQTLQNLYGSVDNIDAFVGFLAEDLQPDSSVGETIGVILREQFTRLRDGDRFYFENSLLPQEAEVIRQTTLSDIIRRNTDTDIIQDNAFSLRNLGSDGDDVLNGGLGDDLVFGNGGNDLIRTHAGEDTVFGGGGDDVMIGGVGGDRLNGSTGADTLIGGGGDDTLLGGSGSDVLNGTNAQRRGIAEHDVLTGGAGGDRFILGDVQSAYYLDGHPAQLGFADFATITDFDPSEDVIQLHGSVQNYRLEEFPIGGGSSDYQLRYRPTVNGSEELIAILEDVSSTLSVNSSAFTFV